MNRFLKKYFEDLTIDNAKCILKIQSLYDLIFAWKKGFVLSILKKLLFFKYITFWSQFPSLFW